MADDETIKIIITASNFPAPIPLSNGVLRADLPLREPFDIAASLLPTLENMEDVTWHRIGEAGGEPLTKLDIREDFDAAAILEGTIDDITPVLSELTGDELTSLREAEKAGANRKGVLTAIDKALAAAN